MLKKVAEGYKFLMNKYGKFSIDSKMIFISVHGEPFIWMHHNLAVNHPQFPIPQPEIA